jgi:hypothetical protein
MTWPIDSKEATARRRSPKPDKNKKKDAVPTSPFASARNPAVVASGYTGKKT